MTVSVTVAGERGRLTLRASGYEFPDKQTGSDANWLRGEVELTTGNTGTFAVRLPVWLYTDDLRRFRDALRDLLASLSGEAVLDHIESNVGCRITLEDGSGELTAFVREHVGGTSPASRRRGSRAELRVEKILTDQTYLVAALEDLDAALRAFPVRGVPH
jgi:hypothetical protein